MAMNLRLDWATHKAADYACRHWHYSGSVPRGKLVKIGVWESQVFRGVVIFARGASSSLVSRYGCNQLNSCELARVALRSHEAPVSRILSIAIKIMKKSFPGMRLIVSFADRSQGHHGGIYQACGWVYTGTSAHGYAYRDKRGKIWHSRRATKSGWVKGFDGRRERCAKIDECTKIFIPGKHRYLLPLDEEMRTRVKKLSKAYPKRAESIENDAPANHAGKGGATPTSALQSST